MKTKSENYYIHGSGSGDEVFVAKSQYTITLAAVVKITSRRTITIRTSRPQLIEYNVPIFILLCKFVLYNL